MSALKLSVFARNATRIYNVPRNNFIAFRQMATKIGEPKKKSNLKLLLIGVSAIVLWNSHWKFLKYSFLCRLQSAQVLVRFIQFTIISARRKQLERSSHRKFSTVFLMFQWWEKLSTQMTKLDWILFYFNFKLVHFAVKFEHFLTTQDSHIQLSRLTLCWDSQSNGQIQRKFLRCSQGLPMANGFNSPIPAWSFRFYQVSLLIQRRGKLKKS